MQRSASRFATLFVLPLFAFASGCNTTAPGTRESAPPNASSSPPAPPKTSTPAPDPVQSLRPGMKPAEIEAVMGTPTSVETRVVDGVEIVVWTYERPRATRVNLVAATMEEVPWVDPITGELRYLREPGATPERIRETEVITLFLASGQLAEVRRDTTQERSFSP
jgi:hypothetical protein